MDIKALIEKEEKQLKLFKTLKLVSILAIVLGAIIYVMTIVLTVAELTNGSYSFSSEAEMYAVIYKMITMPITIAVLVLMMGIAGTVVFSIFSKKKQRNINKFQNDLISNSVNEQPNF